MRENVNPCAGGKSYARTIQNTATNVPVNPCAGGKSYARTLKKVTEFTANDLIAHIQIYLHETSKKFTFDNFLGKLVGKGTGFSA